MLTVRQWAVRHAGAMERTYGLLQPLLRALRPVVRALGARRVARPLAALERTVKGFLFDCRMCGRCTLSRTGMSCPMNCPKQVRNGPCGGVRADGRCELRDMRCVWVDGWEGSLRMRAGALPATPLPPAEHQETGRSSWLGVIVDDAQPVGAPRHEQPATSALQRLLERGHFAVTAELSPPDSADPDALLRSAEPLRGVVDALNVTDAAGACCHLSSLAACALLAQQGFDPILQLTCRDRNRIALQGDILGAAALGISNLLCLTGDGVAHGDHPGARPVFDLDAVSLLDTARTLRDGRFLSGRPLTAAPRLFLGAADNPFAPPFDARPVRLEQKIAAGARFVQTQYCFDVEVLKRYLARLHATGLHERCFILVGVGPLVSAQAARWMRRRIPGVHIPDAVVSRLQRAADPRREGVRLCVETIERLRALPGIAGVHVMAHRHQALVPEIVAAAGLRTAREVNAETAA